MMQRKGPINPEDLDAILQFDDGELADAQSGARERESASQFGRAGEAMAYAFTGKPAPRNDFWDTQDKNARRGVEDLQTKRKSMVENATLRATAQDSDPNSARSVAARELLARVGGLPPERIGNLSAAQVREMGPFFQKHLDLEYEKQKATNARTEKLGDRADERTYEEKQAEIKFGRDKELAGIRANNAFQNAKDLAELNNRLKVESPPAPKPPPNVPAGEAAQIGQLSAAEKMVDDLFSSWESKAGSPMSGLAKFVPGTDAAQYDDNKLAAAQAIGTILEGGKLTDADLQKYMNLVPTQGDSRERAAAKRDQLRGLIQQARTSKIGGLGQAGYDVSGFSQGAPAAAAPQAPSGGGFSPEKKARLEELRRKRDAGQLQ